MWHDILIKLVIESKVVGKQTRGRRRIALLDGVMNRVSYALLKKGAQGRRIWRDKLAVPLGTCYTAELLMVFCCVAGS